MANMTTLRRALLTCTAVLSTISVSAQAQTTSSRPVAPQTGSVEPQWGDIRTFWGDIRTFDGEVNPYWGDIRTFWGDVNPYWGDIRTFWGDIRTFNEVDPATVTGLLQKTTGTQSVLPYWGDIRTFAGDVGAAWGDIRTFWGDIRTFQDAPGDYQALATKIDGIVSRSEQTFGAAVAAQTGKSFKAGFADPLLAKYGIDLSRPETLAKLDANKRERFFLDWYDNLMQFSGADHADHWMKQVNWSPKLTQTQGSGKDATIGLVDFFVAADDDIKSKTIWSGGYTTNTSAHGAGVGSLIVASHDGKGVMGIAPNAKVVAYNPFDATQTASWDDVKKGIQEVGKRDASVINLSLGKPGMTFAAEWRDVFKDGKVKDLKDVSLFVIAAGNDGVTQTQNVNMKDTFDSTYIVVGSVDPTGNISNFSNRPGTICLLDDKTCKASNNLKESGYLMNRFIVAPGEMILVSDGAGGVTRMSGTSFAAPLVAGAAALIQDRWPWMKKYPRDVAMVLLGSAKDLGAPGIDPVYGVGMLDIEAANAPLDFNALKYYLVDGTKQTEVKIGDVRKYATDGMPSIFSTKTLYFSAFEKLDQGERDFLIPLNSRLIGEVRNGEFFQDFVYNRFSVWINGGAMKLGAHGYGFSDLGQGTAFATDGFAVSMRGRVAYGQTARHGLQPELRSVVDLDLPKFGFSVGRGDGAAVLGGTRNLQLNSDLDARNGGNNPLLGYASGGTVGQARFTPVPGLKLSFGVSENRREDGIDLAGVRDLQQRAAFGALRDYRASATTMRVDYQASTWLGVSATYTRLKEDGALFGTRSMIANDFGRGTSTSGMTLAADAGIVSGLSLFGSATAARSASADRSANLRISSDGLVGTAYQLGIAKSGLLGKADLLRVSVAQPMTIERGGLDYTWVKVVDRETGEKGVVTERVDVGAPDQRRLVGEVMYGQSIGNGLADVNLIGRANMMGDAALGGNAAVELAGSFRLRF